MVVVIPLALTATARNVAECVFRLVLARYGLPTSIVLDCDPKFVSLFWSSLHGLLGVKVKMSTSAYLQTDGRVEVTNKTIGAMLRTLAKDDPTRWAKLLPACEFTLNSTTSTPMGLTLFKVVQGPPLSPTPKSAPAPASAPAAPAPSSAAKPDRDASAAPPAAAEPEPAAPDATDEAADADDGADIGPAGTGPVVDMDVFGQLLEIDDDEEHEFSKTLAFDYITQAEATFLEIEEALTSKDLDALSRKGHFLKGSSAALGLQRVQHSCEAMQYLGQRREPNGEGPEVSEGKALARCRKLLVRLKEEQAEAKSWLEEFYKDTAPSA
ncbi:hypothetical protein JCM3770_003609 [Rhodotorula araucariae]